MVEILGYVASAVIIFALTRTSIVRLRTFGLVGAVLFAAYGALVQAWPVVITNLIILALHSFFLFRAFTDEEFFTLLEVRPESRYLEEFLDFHADDIAKSQPDFVHDPSAKRLVFLVLRNTVPAGVFIGESRGPGRIAVDLDYVTPRYRDLKAARFLFGTSRDAFTQRGFTTVSATGTTELHRSYLRKLGFQSSGHDRFDLDL